MTPAVQDFFVRKFKNVEQVKRITARRRTIDCGGLAKKQEARTNLEYAKQIADKTRRPRPPDALFLRQKALITQCKNQVNNISLEPLPKQAAPSTAEPAPRAGRKSSSSIFDKDKLDALEKMNDNSILVQTIGHK